MDQVARHRWDVHKTLFGIMMTPMAASSSRLSRTAVGAASRGGSFDRFVRFLNVDQPPVFSPTPWNFIERAGRALFGGMMSDQPVDRTAQG
jgi:hypothetical protein